MTKKVVFLGSKEVGYAAFKHLIDHAQELDIELVGVLSNDRKISATEPSILELAKTHEIPILSATDELLFLQDVSFLISVQYHEILLQKHIDCAQELAINLHMAPLPEYRGCNQFSFAIIDGAATFGTTLHVLESGIDSGAILFEKRFAISPNETVQTLHHKTTEESITLFKNSIAHLIQGNYVPTPQQDFTDIRPFGFHLRNEINGLKEVDLNWNEDKIDRYIRATYFPPFPLPYAIVNGEKMKLSLNWKAEIINSPLSSSDFFRDSKEELNK
tara:strand:- start:1852 stop:2673 length:822 start_codon:yes stop_codon:yes gene_type:complete